MVVVQPACCTQAQWTTTNSKYGDFYVSIHKEAQRLSEPVVHKECTKKANALGKELSDVKAKLECLKQRCEREPCPKTGFILPPGADLNPNLFSPKIGKCYCPSGPGPPNSNPYISVCKNEFNGAKQHDPQFLEEHIKKEHPRLVKQVHPLKPCSVPCITGSGDHFPEDEQNGSECGSRGGSKGDSDRLRRCKMIGLYKRTDTQCPPRCGSQEKSNNNNMHVRIVENSANKCNQSRSNDDFNLNPRPTSDQRYNFYRYYDKHFSGFNLGDIFYNNDENTYNQAMQERYLEEIFPCIKSYISSTPNFAILPCSVHSEQCPKFINNEQCSITSYGNKCPKIFNGNIETRNFDFCCYGKLSQGEIRKFYASKISKCLISNNKILECLKSNKFPYFISKRILPPCFELNKPSTPSLDETKEILYKLFNTQGTQINEEILEKKHENVQKSSLVCELDVFVKPNCDLHNGSIRNSISGSVKNSSSANFYKSKKKNNEEKNVEKNVDHWKPRLCYEVEISPRRDGIGYEFLNVNVKSQKNVRKNILKCVEIENKQSQAHFTTNKEPKELSFELNFEPKVQRNIDEIDFVEDKMKSNQNLNTFQNKIKDFQLNPKIELDFDGIENYKKLNNDAIYVKAKVDKVYRSFHINQSTKNEKDSNNTHFSGVNVSSHPSQDSSIKIKSIENQNHNVHDINTKPLSTLRVDSKEIQLHNQLEPELSSTQNFIFGSLDPLYLNLYLNYDGHHMDQLKTEAYTD